MPLTLTSSGAPERRLSRAFDAHVPFTTDIPSYCTIMIRVFILVFITSPCYGKWTVTLSKTQAFSIQTGNLQYSKVISP